MFVPELSANIWRISNKNKIIEIGRLTLNQPVFQLRNDSTNTLNIKYITDKLKKKGEDENQKRMKIVVHNLEYLDGRFSLENKNMQRYRKGGIDFGDLKINHINFIAKRFITKNQGMSFHIKEMDFEESTGFRIIDFESDVEIMAKNLTFRNNDIITNDSRVYSSVIDMNFSDYQDFTNFIEKVNMFVEIEKSSIFLKDLAFFAPTIGKINKKVKFSGSLNGTISNFHGRNINASVGENTVIKGKMDISGLPNINDTYWFLKFDKLQIQPEEISSIENIGNSGFKLEFPNQIFRLGLMSYHGVFTGFYNDFVSYGTLNTQIGELKTDISIKPNQNHSTGVMGKVNALNFDLGKFLLKENLFGKTSMELSVNGSVLPDKGLTGNLKGNISSFEFSQYNYQNINLNGTFHNKSFDGSINIDDPNIEFDFLGLVDLGKDKNEFDFSLVVPKANLYNLNLVPNDTTSRLSFILTSSITGNSIEDMNGNIKVINAKYQSMDKELQTYNLFLEANNDPDTSWIVLNSEYADISLSGNYEFKKIIPAIYSLQANFLPSTLRNLPDTTGIYKNNFHFDANFKNLNKIADFFFPNYAIAPNSRITGSFRPSEKELILEGTAEYFYAGKQFFEKPGFILSSKKFKNLTFAFNSEETLINNKLEFSRFSLHSDLANDTIVLGISWFQKDSLLYKGDVTIHSFFSRDELTNSLQTQVFIPSTTVIHKSIPWKISQDTIQIDSNAVRIGNFSIESEDRSLSVIGRISEMRTDTLYVNASNMELNAEKLLQGNLHIGGNISGNAKISGIYDSIMFLSQLQFNDLKINDVPFGAGYLHSSWDNDTKSVKLFASTILGTLEQFHAEGNLFPGPGTISLDVELNKFKIKAFQPFVKAVSGNIGGIASGELNYSGKLRDPVISGRLNLQKASMLIDYLNTIYSFSAPVEIDNNVFKFNNIEIFDTLGNKAIGNGNILTHHFKDLLFDLRFETDNLLMLNLNEWQNDLFYGTAFGSGSVSLKGPTEYLAINISATTNQNTMFFIPLENAGELEDLNYIKFVTSEPKEKPRIKFARRITWEATKLSGNLILNMNLSITPDAEASVLFNPNAGGSLTGKGLGNIQMKVDKEGNFTMSGEYAIDQGTYNFSLSQVINKKFEVKPGSRIIWNGDPANATLDVIAIYQVRTSLYNLFYDDAYRRRVPVDCEVHLTGKLETPDISFNIDLPTSDEDTKTRLKNAISTEEDLNKQFLSLLVLNSFMPNPNYSGAAQAGTGSAVEATTYELLSNQLSNWLSQISNDFDIGFHYRPGDQVSSQEIEVALSTQILNDRVLINSNIDIGQNQNQTINRSGNIVGDVSVEVKIDKKGKFRVKAFTRPNDKLIYETSPYTTGLGVFFREDFNSFGSLMKGYWNRIFKKKKKKN